MFKQQLYDIRASFLIPAYNMPNGVHSTYITTQKGYHANGSIAIDVWLVRATMSDTKQSMVKSLENEEKTYHDELDKAMVEEKSENNMQKSDKVRKLEHGQKVFADLVKMAKNDVYHKQPDDEFLQIARRNMVYQTFSQYKPDLKNYLYLAGLSYYEER